MLRQELQSYLDSIYTDFKIDMECSHSEKFIFDLSLEATKNLGRLRE